MDKLRVLATATLLFCSGCSLLPFDLPFDDQSPSGPSNGIWDTIGPTPVNQDVQLPNGQTAHVVAAWQSALGLDCKRVNFTPSQTSEVGCRGNRGWYGLRDLSKPGI